MRESLKKAQKAYYARQKEKGVVVRTFRLTAEEWQKVKEFIRKMREQNENGGA